MNPDYTAIFEVIKSSGVALGIITGIFAIIANWRVLFAPYQKKLKDEEFDLVKQLVQKLADPRFLIFYTEPLSSASLGFAKDAVVSHFYSPFLPKSLRKPTWDYIASVFTLKVDAEEERDELFERHRALYRRATTLLGARGAKLPDFNAFRTPQPEEPPLKT